MKIDDGYIFLENGELVNKLWFLDSNRIIPKYIEKAILKIYFEELSILYNEKTSINELLNRIPKEYINKIIEDSNMFNKSNKINYRNKHLSYLIYYLPQNIYKIWRPLIDLTVRGLLKHDISILDIGTGPGSIPIGIIEYYKIFADNFSNINFSINLKLIDVDETFLNIANKIIESIKLNLPSNLTITISSIINRKIDKNFKWISAIGEFDLIIISNFIHPNEDKDDCNLIDFLEFLKNNNMNKKSSLIIIEPGNMENCISFKTFRNQIINNNILNIFSPCIPIWDKKDKYECNCFNSTFSYWNKPEIYNYLQNNGLGKRRKDYVPFIYVVFRKDNRKKYFIEKNMQGFVKLNDISENNYDTVNVKGIIRLILRSNKTISICDGSIDCSKNPIYISFENYPNYNKFTMNVGEKIVLRKARVLKVNKENINLSLDKNSIIEINY